MTIRESIPGLPFSGFPGIPDILPFPKSRERGPPFPCKYGNGERHNTACYLMQQWHTELRLVAWAIETAAQQSRWPLQLARHGGGRFCCCSDVGVLAWLLEIQRQPAAGELSGLAGLWSLELGWPHSADAGPCTAVVIYDGRGPWSLMSLESPGHFSPSHWVASATASDTSECMSIRRYTDILGWAL